MKRNKGILLAIIATIVVLCAFALSGCGNPNDGKDKNSFEKSFTISCASEMNVGSRIEITIKKSYDFDMNYKNNEWKIVGDNTVEGSFEFENAGGNNTKTFFRAHKPGDVKIQATNNTNEYLESNVVEITVNGSYITTVNELKNIANNNSCFLLGNDLDLSLEDNWTPIENFTGTFNGNGYKISGLNLSVKSSDNVGLFGELKGTVSGLKLTDIKITGSGSGNNVGGIAGKNSGSISGCEVSGNIDCDYASCVGGIVGYSNSNLADNINSANVKSMEKVGGIAGSIIFTGTQILRDNMNKGEIQGESYIGGISGEMDGERPVDYKESTYIAKISDNTNSGAITASGDYAGGIAGKAAGIGRYEGAGRNFTLFLEISDCENSGKVVGKDYVAGIYGFGNDYLKSVTACVNSADISGANFVGGYAGHSSEAEFSNMVNENKISGKAYLGGIAGYAGNIKNCKNKGGIKSDGTIVEDQITKCCVGGIAGYCYGLNGCENTVDIEIFANGSYVGGLAGQIYCRHSLESNNNSGTVTAANCDYVGGIVGRIVYIGSTATKDNNNSKAVIGKSYIGGIAGEMNGERPVDYKESTYIAKISDNTNSGAITASGDYAGGIAGKAAGIGRYEGAGHNFTLLLEISDCENSGKVCGSGHNYAAIIGKAEPDFVNRNTKIWATNKNSGEVENDKIYN